MQQLNVLPINVSQSIETKDESAAFISTSSKKDFSQYIDTQLAKNKDVSAYNKREVDNKLDENTVKTFYAHASVKADEQTQQNPDDSLTSADEVASANNTQAVAASGKDDGKTLNQDNYSEAAQALDESALLMSFLIKADNTLTNKEINKNTAESINIDEVSAEQIAKTQAQLLLTSSDLVANLSEVAKALKPNSEIVPEQVDEQEPLVKNLLETTKNASKNGETSQLNEKPLIEGEETLLKGKIVTKENAEKPKGDLVANDKSIVSQPLNATKLAEGNAVDSTAGDNKKLTELTAKLSLQDLLNNELASKVVSNVDEVDQATNQQTLNNQSLTSEIKGTEPSNVKSVAIPAPNEQVAANANNLISDNVSEVAASVDEQISQLAQAANGVSKLGADLATAISVSQHSLSNKNLSAANLGQASTEMLIKQGDLVESEGELTAKSVDNLIDQNKAFNSAENKDVSNKVLVKSSTEFSINSNFTDVTGNATQAMREGAEEQYAADILTPIGSSEVSQSQKTNVQLQQETISIFRKDFADAVKDKVMLIISQKLQQFDISLDPPELGNVQVRVNLQGEQAVVNFVVQNQQAKEAFEQNMYKLRELLSEQGVDVGDANVEQQSQESCNEESEQGKENSRRDSMANTTQASDVVEHNLSARMLNSSTTAVDYYA